MVNALSPVDGQTVVAVVLCQKTAGAYSMKFGGTPDCAVGDGTLVPVAGTYGGEGDGGIDAKPNLGVHKQQFFAKLADVPVAGSWTYSAGKDKDWLVLPVQLTQSGGGPKFDAYHAVASQKGSDGWTDRTQTFSHACAGCHDVSMSIGWESQSGKSYITSFDYQELNVGCESCHGPGSDHINAPNGEKPNVIIRPSLLTAKAERQLCGKCHGAHDGESSSPPGLGYPWNANNAGKLGNGEFFAGAYDLGDYLANLASGGFVTWPDGQHAKEHRQQFSMLELSVHVNNSTMRLACSNCHNPHSQVQGPASALRTDANGDTYEFVTPRLDDNTLCLGCHAESGVYSAVTKVDVANVQVGAGGTVNKNGKPYTPGASDIATSQANFADNVTMHMTVKSAMTLAGYDPLNDAEPVGRCPSCHMARTGKSGGWTIDTNVDGLPAMVMGDSASHVFDVVFPWMGQATTASAQSITDVMPNACGRCHTQDRFVPAN